jgi:phosphatidylglycerophosphate synthase
VGAAVFELNLPNFLTVFRILLVPVLVAALLSEGPEGDLLAATVFAVASFTDALDGWIARRNKSESTFGKLMDALADKLLVTSALVSLVSLDRLSVWVDGIVYVTVAITVLSGADYFFGLRRLLRSGAAVEPVAQRDVAR